MRYALYFTPPPDHPLTIAAADWLGRDAFSGAPTRHPRTSSLSTDEIAFHSAAARRYGFHATLKAPFTLAHDETESGLRSAVAGFAAARQAFAIPRLMIVRLDGFFALVPAEPVPMLQAFAADVVKDFDRFRAPLTDADMARRNLDALKPDQMRNLVQWGYPYVLDSFRFHMTLTGRIADADVPAVRAALDQLFVPLLQRPVIIDALTLFVEAEPGAPFNVLQYERLEKDVKRKSA